MEVALDRLRDASNSAVRDQAALSLLWEGGLRKFELRELRIGDVQPSAESPKALRVSISSSRTGRKPSKKTHPRDIEVFESVEYLKRWLQLHPTPDNEMAILFPSLSNNNLHGMVSSKAINDLTSLAYGDAPFPHDPYWHRHSRITYVLRTRMLTVDEAADFFGTGISMLMKHYRHVLAGQVGRNYLSNYEDALVERPKPKALVRKFCPGCTKPIPKGAKMCPYCDMLLRKPTEEDMAAEMAERREAKQSHLDALVEAIAQADNPQARTALLDLYQRTKARPVDAIASPRDVEVEALHQGSFCGHCGEEVYETPHRVYRHNGPSDHGPWVHLD